MYARRGQRKNYFIRTSRNVKHTNANATLHTTDTHKQNDTCNSNDAF